MASVLVLYATIEGHTARIAERFTSRLREQGVSVDLREAEKAAPFESYDGIVVGASVHYGRHPSRLRALLRSQRHVLTARPGAFFSVSLSAKEHYAAKFLRQVGWQPQLSATFAGALQYSKYGPFKRLLLTGFAWMGGHDTDTSRDYEYTNWKAVDSFATAFTGHIR